MSPRRKAVLLAKTDAVPMDLEQKSYLEKELTAE